MAVYKNKPGRITIEVTKYGTMSARFRYSDNGLVQIRLGDLPVSPTPLLDVILTNGPQKLDAEQLVRLRDTDKSWNLLARFLS